MVGVPNARDVHEAGLMVVFREHFYVLVIRLAKEISRSAGILRIVWLGSAKLNCPCFTNEPRFLFWEVIPADRRSKKERFENVKFVCTRTARSGYTNFDGVSDQSTLNISLEEWRFVDIRKPMKLNRFINGEDEDGIGRYDFQAFV